MEYIFIILIWLVFCYIASSVASKNGRDSTGYFLLALFTSPLLTLLILLIIGDSDQKRFDQVKQVEKIKSNIRNDETLKKSIPNLISNKYENLEKLGNLLEKGVLSKEEFEKEKKMVLSDLDANFKSGKEQQPDMVRFNEVEVFNRINEEITKAKGNLWGAFNEELIVVLEKNFTEKHQANFMLKRYEEQFQVDLIERLKTVSNSFSSIEKYLKPFIVLEIVHSKDPHNRIV